MGFSGPGLYDDDAGFDARSGYRELIADGATGPEATDVLIARWGDALDIHDEACAFWLALADTQWRVGRLEDRVRDRAKTIIASGEDLLRFAHDESLLKRRRKVLEDLASRLAQPQRAPATIRRPFRAISPIGLGDVVAYALDGGRRVYLRAVAISGSENDNYPTVEVLDAGSDRSSDDPAALPARAAIRQPDLFSLYVRPKDPDPAKRISLLAKAAPVSRSHVLPAVMVRWIDLEEDLVRHFGKLEDFTLPA